MTNEKYNQIIIKYKKNKNLSGQKIAELLPSPKYKLVLFGNGSIGTRAAFNTNEDVSKEEVEKDLTIKLFHRKPLIEVYSIKN